MNVRTMALAIVVAAASASAALAQTPTKINDFNKWAAYRYAGQSGVICYILAKPEQELPATRNGQAVNHGQVVFMVSNRPSEGVTGEPMFQVGYPFRQGSEVSVTVDGKPFVMFTSGDGAWTKNPSDDQSLVAAMRAGNNMEVSGVSSRGTNTRYIYSLSGVTAALREISNCS